MVVDPSTQRELAGDRSIPENEAVSHEQRDLRRAGAQVSFCLVLLGAHALADVPDSQRSEVAHLLRFIRTTPCGLVRNGREYQGERAYEHVMRKYDYFRDKIMSTEDFIALAATRSELSKRPYEFRCSGAPSVPAAEVLSDELRRFRAANPAVRSTG